MTASQHTIAGTVLTMPVKVRKATQHMAMFSVDADAAQRMIDYSGLRVGPLSTWPCGRRADPRALHRRRSRRVPRIQHQRDGQPARVQGAGYALCSLRLFTTCWSIRPSLWKLDARSGAFRKSCPTSRFMMGSVWLRREHRRSAGGRHGIPSRPPGSVGAHLPPAGVALVCPSRRSSRWRLLS